MYVRSPFLSGMAKREDFLAQLSGSSVLAKALRFFVMNGTECFCAEDISRLTSLPRASVRRETAFLFKIGIVKKCSLVREETKGSGKRRKTKKVRMPGWALNKNFEHLSALKLFVRSVSPVQSETIPGKLRGIGKLSLVVASGSFVGESDGGRIDLLIVGDKLDERRLKKALHDIEVDLGQEVRYAAFPTEEFRYRLNIYDKLVRDVFDEEHQVLFDRLGLVK